MALLHSMWNLPRPGTELVSPALAGGLLSTAPPEKSQTGLNSEPTAVSVTTHLITSTHVTYTPNIYLFICGCIYIDMHHTHSCKSPFQTKMSCVHSNWLQLCLTRFSCVWLFATLWTIACQVPLSMGFSRQEYWSGLPCPPPWETSWPRKSNPHLMHWQVGSLPLAPPGKPPTPIPCAKSPLIEMSYLVSVILTIPHLIEINWKYKSVSIPS